MKFFDLQVNGFAGVDFQQRDLSRADFERALEALERHETAILLTLITATIDDLEASLARFESWLRDSPRGSVVEGYHLEGPYLSPEPGYHGAHPPGLMKAPDRGEFDRLWTASGGRLRIITLAPELPGSVGFIHHARGHRVVLSIGHSRADDRDLDAAIEAGLSMCTHLGNGVPLQLHRHDNIIQRLLARDELDAVFIPDGIHVPRATLQNFVRAKPRERVLFTTDCMSAAGAAPGRYRIGAVTVDVGPDGVVREPGKENFAGSSLTMGAAQDNVVRLLGWAETEALAACGNRARVAAGLPRNYTISRGMPK